MLTPEAVNLPIGGVVLAIVTIFLPSSVGKSSPEFENKTRWEIFMRFDPIGTAIIIPSIICFLLALQWGGLEYSWSSPRVIVTLVCFGVSIIAWFILQIFQGDNATMPRSVIGQRSVIGATIYALCSSASFSAVVYYLPIW
jgi:hypothetical protein